MAELIVVFERNGFYPYGSTDKSQWSLVQNQTFPTK